MTPDPAAPPAATVAPIRYGVLPNAADYAPMERLQSRRVQVSVLTGLNDPADYDVQVGFGNIAGWEAVPMELAPVSLVLDVTRPPFDDPALVQVVRQAVAAEAIVAEAEIIGMQALAGGGAADVRGALAKAGYPDGFSIYGRIDRLPGAAAVVAQLAEANITVTPTQAENAHLRLARLADSERGAAEQAVIDLYTLPMSYTVRDGLLVTFTDDGWVVAAREDE